jgi:hypothetical protein
VCEPTGYGVTMWQCHAIPRSRSRVVALPLVWMSLPAPCPHHLPAPPSVGPAVRHEESTMTIPPELEAQILRYHHVEKWRVGTIAFEWVGLMRLPQCASSIPAGTP